MQNNITDGLATVASHPLIVQVINQGTGIWGNVVTGLITAVAAIGAVMLTHRFTLNREKNASDNKIQRERYFIATELVCLLERFAQGCVDPAHESGYVDPQYRGIPEFSYERITGDWRSLPPELMYQLRQLPVLHQEALQSIYAAYDNDNPSDCDSYLSELKSQSSRLGLKAIRLSRELRQICSMPHDDLSNHSWSTWRRLSSANARIINDTLHSARRHYKFNAVMYPQKPTTGLVDSPQSG